MWITLGILSLFSVVHNYASVMGSTLHVHVTHIYLATCICRYNYVTCLCVHVGVRGTHTGTCTMSHKSTLTANPEQQDMAC